MGLDELLGYNPETAAVIISGFLKTGKSKELDLVMDSSRWELPSSELICAAGYFRQDRICDYGHAHDNSISLGVHTRLRQATAYLTDNYKFDGDKKYLTQLIVISGAFDEENAFKFYEKLQKSDFYNKLGKHLKSLINENYKDSKKHN